MTSGTDFNEEPLTLFVVLDSLRCFSALLMSKLARDYRIVCVEDERLVLQQLVGTLAHAGYAAEIAETTEAALAQVNDWATVDLLITDYSMPGRSGLALISDARHAGFAGKVILHSGSVADEARVRAEQQRVDRIINKPAKPGELLTAVRAILPATDFPQSHKQS